MSVNAIGSISGTSSVTDAYTELQRAQQAQAAQAAQRTAEQQVLPVAQTPQQQSKPITASASALGGSFDVTV